MCVCVCLVHHEDLLTDAKTEHLEVKGYVPLQLLLHYRVKGVISNSLVSLHTDVAWLPTAPPATPNSLLPARAQRALQAFQDVRYHGQSLRCRRDLFRVSGLVFSIRMRNYQSWPPDSGISSKTPTNVHSTSFSHFI